MDPEPRWLRHFLTVRLLGTKRSTPPGQLRNLSGRSMTHLARSYSARRYLPACSAHSSVPNVAGVGEAVLARPASHPGPANPRPACKGAPKKRGRLNRWRCHGSAGYCNPHVDKLARKAQAQELGDPAAARKLWAQVDRIVTDQAPWVPLKNAHQLYSSPPESGTTRNPLDMGLCTTRPRSGSAASSPRLRFIPPAGPSASAHTCEVLGQRNVTLEKPRQN